MPELCRFYGIVIKMFFFDNVQHSKPHVHAYYNEYEATLGIDGEMLAGSLPVIYTHLFVTLVTMLAYIYIGYSLDLPRFYLYAAACALLLAASTFFEPIQANFFLAFLAGRA